MQQEQIDLGHKRTCPHCGAKYYDFYQEELDCPQCGKSIEAINITIGLPFLKITPDHGPNQDMMGKNKSDPTSIFYAFNFLNKIK